MTTPPISAIVIFRDEERLLEGCLRGVRDWCDEVIAIDMASRDGSRDVAGRFADRLFEVDPFPIAEPTRVAAAAIARHDWVLLIDPDEHVSPTLVPRIARAMRDQPDAAAFGLPWLFHFKGKPLAGTVWGGAHRTKRMLVHRRRCQLLPYCNRIVEPMPGHREAFIPGEGDAFVNHHWCDSYRQLLHRHLARYPRLDAARMRDEGKRFSLARALTRPAAEFHRSFRHMDGWRLGPRGLALSAVFAAYTAAYEWLLLAQGDTPTRSPAPTIPQLREVPIPARARRAAA